LGKTQQGKCWAMSDYWALWLVFSKGANQGAKLNLKVRAISSYKLVSGWKFIIIRLDIK